MSLYDQIRIHYEDQHVLLIEKPAGLLAQPDKREPKSILSWARHYLNTPSVGLIHRIDRNVSGLLLLAKHTQATSALGQALQKRKIHRSYLGWCRGKLYRKHTWTHWVKKNPVQNKVSIARYEFKKSKKAVLHCFPKKTRIFQKKLWSLVCFQLETGRPHQIRVQSTFEKHALLGDHKYASMDFVPFPQIALHAFQIIFPHPVKKTNFFFQIPLPKLMRF